MGQEHTQADVAHEVCKSCIDRQSSANERGLTGGSNPQQGRCTEFCSQITDFSAAASPLRNSCELTARRCARKDERRRLANPEPGHYATTHAKTSTTKWRINASTGCGGGRLQSERASVERIDVKAAPRKIPEVISRLRLIGQAGARKVTEHALARCQTTVSVITAKRRLKH